MCTSAGRLCFPPLNRVFAVETFSTLISRRQTLVSSDTSCAVGIRRDLFVSSLTLCLVCYLHTDAAWEPGPQSAGQRVKKQQKTDNFSQYTLQKPSQVVLPLRSIASLSLTYTLCSCQCDLKYNNSPPSHTPPPMFRCYLPFGAVHRARRLSSGCAVCLSDCC